MKFVNSTQAGEPVEPGEPDRVAHRYAGRDGEPVVVLRDARGRLLPGSALVLLRSGERRPATGGRHQRASRLPATSYPPRAVLMRMLRIYE